MIFSIVNNCRNIKALHLVGNFGRCEGLPAIQLPEYFIDNLKSLTLVDLDFYLPNENDSFTFVRQCVNLRFLNINLTRGNINWNDQLFQFLPNLESLKGNQCSICMTTEKTEDFTIKEGCEEIILPKTIPNFSLFYQKLVYLDIHVFAKEMRDDFKAVTCLREVFKYCHSLRHLSIDTSVLTASDQSM